jgi:CRISPR-associated protein Cas1
LELHGGDRGLDVLVSLVRSGDPLNVEAQASRRYWPALFADPNFRRERAFDDQNRLLNWGYAILRAMVARAICAAGLHPSVGVQHHNRYNAFCLADDLMEPFRPLVDRIVAGWVREHGRLAPLDRAFKQQLLEVLAGRWDAGGEVRTLFDVLARSANSLANVFIGETARIEIPVLKLPDAELQRSPQADGASGVERPAINTRRSSRLRRPPVDPLADVG